MFSASYDALALVAFSVLGVTVNKYVLSSLHFTLPTVFQGWQTLVCVLLLSTFLKYSQFCVEIEKLDRKTLLKLFVPIIFFTLGNVAGSKALADLPVAVFSSGSNCIPACVTLFDSVKYRRFTLKTTGSLVLICSLLATFTMLNGGGHNAAMGWLWLFIHIVSLAIHFITICSLKLHPTTSVYYLNFSSVLILLPLSIYLQEAHSALNHARHAKLEFYVGCCLSGVLGTGIQLLSARLQNKTNISFYYGVAKILACTMSLAYFPNNLSHLAWLVVVTNLVLGCFLFLPEDIHDKIKSPEQFVA